MTRIDSRLIPLACLPKEARMLKTKTYFKQVPLESVKKIVAAVEVQEGKAIGPSPVVAAKIRKKGGSGPATDRGGN
jgi:hypothetical protein